MNRWSIALIALALLAASCSTSAQEIPTSTTEQETTTTTEASYLREIPTFTTEQETTTTTEASYLWPKEYRDREILLPEIKEYTDAHLGFTPTGSYVEFVDYGETRTNCYEAPAFEVVDLDNFPVSTLDFDGAVMFAYYGVSGECAPYDPATRDGGSRTPIAWAEEGIDTAMNPDFAGRPEHLFIEAVIHEEFHDQTWGFWPEFPSLSEGAAKLNGLIGAEKFSCDYYGADSEVCAATTTQVGIYREFVELTNALADDLRALYERVNSGELSEVDGFEQKAVLFGKYTATWNERLEAYGYEHDWAGIDTNAMLGSTRTYTKHFPLLYDLYVAFDEDIGATSKYLIDLSENFETRDLTIADIEAKIVELTSEATSEGP